MVGVLKVSMYFLSDHMDFSFLQCNMKLRITNKNSLHRLLAKYVNVSSRICLYKTSNSIPYFPEL